MEAMLYREKVAYRVRRAGKGACPWVKDYIDDKEDNPNLCVLKVTC
jgi:hypothetical protein